MFVVVIDERRGDPLMYGPFRHLADADEFAKGACIGHPEWVWDVFRLRSPGNE